jgi:hypothetical protein
MTCTSPAHEATSLDEATDRALCWATHSLSQQGRPMLDAIWWLSTHLAASDRVLHRPLRRQREYRQAVAAQRRRARGLQWRLWELDRHVTGDGRLAGRSLAGLTGELRDAVRTYAECESLLLAAMTRHADDDALRRLADDYARAVRRAPTRPHPVAHRLPLVRPVLLRLESVVDHFRDAIDSRHVPMRPARALHVANRWDHYLTGDPSPVAAAVDRSAGT